MITISVCFSCFSIAKENTPELAPSTMYIYHTGINSVNISKKEINRVVSEEPIKDIKFPEGTKISVQIEGNNAYIQYKEKHSTLIYIVTPERVYPIRLNPSKIGAQTLRLAAPEKRKKVITPLVGNIREKAVVKMIKAAFTESPLLEKAKQERLSTQIKFVKYIEVREHLKYSFPEDNIYLKVYILKLNRLFKENKFEVKEINFLTPKLCKNPLGISLDRDYLTKTDYTRLFIVGRE